MSKGPSPSDTARRKWDEAAYSNRARQRQIAETDPQYRRKAFVPAPLRTEAVRRDRIELIDTDALVGSSVVIPDGAAKKEAGGFYCQHCDVLLHDSSAYLNHVNGRFHNSVVGIALKVRASSAAEVRAAFEEAHKRKMSSDIANIGSGTLSDTENTLKTARTLSVGDISQAIGSEIQNSGPLSSYTRKTEHEAKSEECTESAIVLISTTDEHANLDQEELQKFGLPTQFA